MKKNAFSLIEIIFVISIVSIISVVVIPKINNSLNKTNLIKLRGDILLIQDGIAQYKNKLLLKNNYIDFDRLDDDDIKLFSIVLSSPILSSNEQKIGSWSKTSHNNYKVYIDNINSVEFSFDIVDKSFTCNKNNIYCEELN
ncbi:MAG: prepilin-type N-terminal cleavage/methylation domain-containing protein [Campylobacterota bacterium]|nr:prepilin-type N-terminal cleavage/methylation domain-containing protein [Campylobacterota bacterium]